MENRQKNSKKAVKSRRRREFFLGILSSIKNPPFFRADLKEGGGILNRNWPEPNLK